VSLRQLPNLICVARILLVVPIALALYDGNYERTLLIFALAAFSDALDGFLAKRFGWTTELGKVLDPLADKLLLVTVFIMLAVVGITPVWLATLVVARDVVIGLGAWIYRVAFGPLNGRPTAVSKLNTGVQLLYVLAVVSTAGFDRLPPVPTLVLLLGAAVLVTTSVSGIDYVITYTRRARMAARARHAT
jgi:cardiolipin synthase